MKKFNQALARMGFAVFFISFCSVAVAETSCKQELGAAKAQELVEQCINISPATHPPCNIENSCAMIQRGIDHGCNFAKLYGGEVPSYCNVAQDSQASTSAQTQTDQGQQYFKSPSGNIACAFGDGSENFPDHVRCDIYKFTPSYEVPDELKNDPIFTCKSPEEMHSFWVSTNDVPAGFFCPTDALDDSAVLNYGDSISKDGITCNSEKTGMTCTNSSGHGFSLSKAKQKVF